MRIDELIRQAEMIAANRDAGASELLARLLPLLDAAIRVGREATLETVRRVCTGQPAMAPLWNAAAAAMAEFSNAGTFARTRSEMERAPRRLTRAATASLSDALLGNVRPQLLTISYSSSVAAVLCAVAADRTLEVVCGESLPGGEGARMCTQLEASGAAVTMVADAMLTSYLSSAAAVVVGADAMAAHEWTNKCGTFGLAAAASFAATPVYVIASRDKAQAAVLRERMTVPREFERTPNVLATQFLTEAGPISPGDLPSVTERFQPEIAQLLTHF